MALLQPDKDTPSTRAAPADTEQDARPHESWEPAQRTPCVPETMPPGDVHESRLRRGPAGRRRSLSVWRDGPDVPWGTRTLCWPTAVRRGILTADQAELMGRNRLERVPLSQIAAERNVSHTALCN
jgi:hypothetical protein